MSDTAEELLPGNRWKVTALLADGVTAENGKLYVLGGGWDTIAAGQWPAGVGRIGLALIVSVPYMETNRPHDLIIELLDEDGNAQVIAPATASPRDVSLRINIGRPPELQPGDSQSVPLGMHFDRLQFERPGRYAFVVSVDGAELARCDFRMKAHPGTPR